MKYLLDTCTISYFVRGEPRVLTRIKSAVPTDLCISSISLMEIEFGLLLNLERKIKPIIAALIDHINIIPFSNHDATCAAAIRAALQKKGHTIGAYDVLIAGSAVHHGLICVTSNVKEFNRISGLIIEDWRESF